MTQDHKRAAIAKQTTELVRAYCETLEIRPADLPELIAYVGSVLSRSEPQDRPRMALRVPVADLLPQAEIISLERYRAAQSGRAQRSA